MKKIITRDISKEEYHWLDNDIKKGTIVYEFKGVTYGCISDNGIPVSLEKDTTPFFEVPLNAVADISIKEDNTMNDWISVDTKLPLEEFSGEKVCEEYLVCVKSADLEDEKHVMILSFNAENDEWFTLSGMQYNWGWTVSHWMEKPKPPEDK